MAASGVLKSGREVLVKRRETRIAGVAGSRDKVRIKLEGVDGRDQATALRNEWILAREESLPKLPEGEYYRYQLLGLRVVASDGRDIGIIKDIFSTPENDVYVVRTEGREALIPAVDDVVLDIDLKARVVTVEVIPGLLD
jgi:16S rRNA processing protein RimM